MTVHKLEGIDLPISFSLASGYSFSTSHRSFLDKTKRSLYPKLITFAVRRLPVLLPAMFRMLISPNTLPSLSVANTCNNLYQLLSGMRQRNLSDQDEMAKYESIGNNGRRSEEHTSELQSRPHISYAVFCLKKKKKINKI